MIIVALSIPLLPFFLFVFMYSHGNEIDFDAAKKISLTSVDTNYIITDWREEQFSKITLHPNRMYRIENHSNGDCGPGTVAFMTDSLGKPACIMP